MIGTSERVRQAADIFETYGEQIRAMISLKVKERSTADDMYQNLFLSIVQNPVPRDTNRVKSYIYKILTNDIIDENRKSDVYRQFVRAYRERGNHKAMQEDPESEAIELEETRKMLQSLRNQLPAHQAEAVIQRCVLGNDTKDAARKMNLDPKTFIHYLHRGKTGIRQLLKRKRDKGDRNEYKQQSTKM